MELTTEYDYRISKIKTTQDLDKQLMQADVFQQMLKVSARNRTKLDEKLRLHLMYKDALYAFRKLQRNYTNLEFVLAQK